MQALVIDANPIMAALLGGRAREAVFSGKFLLFAAQHRDFDSVDDIRVIRTASLIESLQIGP